MKHSSRFSRRNCMLGLALCLVLILAAFGCGGGGGGEQTTTRVGPEGGQVVSPDGRFTVSFPQGALPRAEDISVENRGDQESSVGGAGERGQVSQYSLFPKGLPLNQPATASFSVPLPRGAAAKGAVFEPFVFVILPPAGGPPQPAPVVVNSVDLDAGTVRVEIGLDRLSDLQIISTAQIRGSQLTVAADGIPESLSRVGDGFVAQFLVNHPETSQTSISSSRFFDSSGPIIALTSGTGAIGGFVAGENRSVDFSARYTCVETGGATNSNFVAGIEFGEYSPSDLVIEGQTFVFSSVIVRFLQQVSCLAPATPRPTATPRSTPTSTPTVNPTPINPTPTPSPTLTPTPTPTPPPARGCQLLSGTYSPNEGTCSFSVLSPQLSGPQTVTFSPFGENEMAAFTIQSNPLTANSQSSNLTINEQSGHSCQLQCSEDGSSFIVNCNGPNSGCSNQFTINT